MNQKSEQLTGAYDIILDNDQPLRGAALDNAVISALQGNCTKETIADKKVLLYRKGAKKIVLLTRAISYLGNPHPTFKKRIQIPADWVDYTRKVRRQGYEVRFLGVYHYEGNIIFADFLADDYLKRNCHNSSAHVYVNDLYQGILNEVFIKIDQNGNHIATVAWVHLKSYLDGKASNNRLLELFARFNYGFSFGEWLNAVDCIQEMHNKKWSQWRQTEWQGWFLEYKFSHFAELKTVQPFIIYTGVANKGHKAGKYDFDLTFPQHNFMGDLKASDIKQTATLGNDQQTFIKCINDYGKFWYVIYEHETVYDRDCNYVATKWRNHYIKDIDHVPNSQFNELSYKDKMKNRVCFRRMYIIELNRINYRQVMIDFHQGHQPDGSKRKLKFSIPKKAIDNFVIYRYGE